MLTFETIKEAQAYLSKIGNKTLGFVPTMGALHTGHIALIERAKAENDLVACSIFVNPTQFNNPEDLKKYPRTLEADLAMLQAAGCDYVFAPLAADMYPSLPSLKFDFGNLEKILEGEFRPGHFNGVGIVVSKLFHIIKPNKAYFGQKDIQQVAVINSLINDLSFDIELVVCDTVREYSGLAKSSRNRRLSATGSEKAANIYKSLNLGKNLLQEGKSISETKQAITKFYSELLDFRLEYYEIVSFENLENLNIYDKSKKSAIVIAAFLEEVRLIDNIVF